MKAPTIKGKVRCAPWPVGLVDRLNKMQADGRFHPYTCGNDRSNRAHVAYQREHGGDLGQLVATEKGWACPVPGCGYAQDWVVDYGEVPK